jgi:hypothetical protein
MTKIILKLVVLMKFPKQSNTLHEWDTYLVFVLFDIGYFELLYELGQLRGVVWFKW